MWQQILSFILGLFQRMGDFSTWLFTRVSLSSALVSFGGVIGGVLDFFHPHSTGNKYIDTITQTLSAFFESQTDWAWTNNINFAPIDVISVGFITALVVFGVIKVINVFA